MYSFIFRWQRRTEWSTTSRNRYKQGNKGIFVSLKFHNQFACFYHSELLLRRPPGMPLCYSNAQHVSLRTSRHCTFRSPKRASRQKSENYENVSRRKHAINCCYVNSTICKPISNSADISANLLLLSAMATNELFLFTVKSYVL